MFSLGRGKVGRSARPYNSTVTIQDVAWRRCWEQWTIKTGGERGSGKSMLAARYDKSPLESHEESDIISFRDLITRSFLHIYLKVFWIRSQMFYVILIKILFNLHFDQVFLSKIYWQTPFPPRVHKKFKKKRCSNQIYGLNELYLISITVLWYGKIILFRV